MILNTALICPINKVLTNTKKESLKRRTPSVINLIIPGHKKELSCFKISKNLIPKLFLSKKVYSLKNIYTNPKYLSLKNNDSTLYLKEKKVSKSNSSHRKITEQNLNEINYKGKNNSFCIQSNNNNIENKRTYNSILKSETFSNVKLLIKNARSFSSSPNINYFTNSDELIHVNKNNNNIIIILNRNNKKLRIKKKSSLFKSKSKSNVISNIKTRNNLSFCDNEKNDNDIYFYNGYTITRNKIPSKICAKIKANISDKENINNYNFTNINKSNINESLYLPISKQNLKKKINLPFSPASNREEFFKQIKYKKYFIRNNKNQSNIPFRKNAKLIKQNSFYNSNSNLIIFKTKDNKKLNDSKKEDSNSFFDIEIYKKTNSMSFFDMGKKTNANSYSYSNTELFISTKENNFEYKANYLANEVEMYHFKIVKIIQNNKLMLLKDENNI